MRVIENATKDKYLRGISIYVYVFVYMHMLVCDYIYIYIYIYIYTQVCFDEIEHSQSLEYTLLCNI